MKHSQTMPIVIYQEVEDHGHSEVARIVLLNMTELTFEDVNVKWHWLGSFGDWSGSDMVDKSFGDLLPGKFVVIQSLSSFDLEFINNYEVTFLKHNHTVPAKLIFKLKKYGVFETDNIERHFESQYLVGRIMFCEEMDQPS